MAEADLHVCTDNPCGAALLALMKAAAHPDDTLAAAQVNMTPLGAVLRAAGKASGIERTYSCYRDISKHRRYIFASHSHLVVGLAIAGGARYSPARMTTTAHHHGHQHSTRHGGLGRGRLA